MTYHHLQRLAELVLCGDLGDVEVCRTLRQDLRDKLWNVHSLKYLEEALDHRDVRRVAELAAGRGGILRELARLVTMEGLVLATEVDDGHLRRLRRRFAICPTVEVVRHDVVADPFPEGPWDAIHARFLFEHLNRASDVLERIVRTLPSGTALMIEDALPWNAFNVDVAVATAIRAFSHDRTGPNMDWGTRLPMVFSSLGLRRVEQSQTHRSVNGGSVEAAFVFLNLLTSSRARETLSPRGQQELRECLADPEQEVPLPPVIHCWGTV